MWDAGAGRRLYIFEGHEAPVYSVCPHYKENIQVNFLTSLMLSVSYLSTLLCLFSSDKRGPWSYVLHLIIAQDQPLFVFVAVYFLHCN